MRSQVLAVEPSRFASKPYHCSVSVSAAQLRSWACPVQRNQREREPANWGMYVHVGMCCTLVVCGKPAAAARAYYSSRKLASFELGGR